MLVGVLSACQVKSQGTYAILSSEIIRPTDVLLPTSVLVVLAFVLGAFGVVLARKRPGKILLTVVRGAVQVHSAMGTLWWAHCWWALCRGHTVVGTLLVGTLW